MNHRILFLVFLGVILSIAGVQAQEVVTWTSNYNEKTQEITVTAKIQDGWHMYSQHIDPNVGPVPTEFEFKSHSNMELIGKVVEPTAIEKYDSSFEANLLFFEGSTTFKQKIKLHNKKVPTSIEASVLYMVCDDSKCLPPTQADISLTLTK